MVDSRRFDIVDLPIYRSLMGNRCSYMPSRWTFLRICGLFRTIGVAELLSQSLPVSALRTQGQSISSAVVRLLGERPSFL